jgi:hypothetical protein
MKKFLCLLFALVLLSGCVQEPKKTEAVFYYPREVYFYNRDDAVVAKEFRDKGGSTSVSYLLDIYLQGPLSDNLQNPFPQNLRLFSVHTDGKTIYMTVTDELATLSGASLILACSCLGMTAMELTGCSSAEIRCESLLLDGRKAIFINENTILYSDSMTDVN